MSDLVAAVSQKLSGAPDELVVRSATARAEAEGIPVDDVLAAWAGGAELGGAAPPPAPAAAPAAPAAPSEPAAAVEEPPAPPAAVTPAVEPVVPAAAVAVIEAPEEEIEPAPLSERLRFGVAVGAIMGIVLGVAGIVLASPLLIDRVDVVGESNEAAVAVSPLAPVLTIAVASGLFGMLVAIVARAVPRFVDRAYAVRGTVVAASVIGAVIGVVLGASAGSLLVAIGEETFDGGALLSVRSGLVVILLGGAALGAVTGGFIQFIGTPAAREEDAERVVRERISNALMVPSLAAVVILGFVVSLGVLLVEFHQAAPLIAIAVAAGILMFSFLMASRPTMRISRGEFLVAVAGVGIVLLLIAAVAAQMRSGEDHSQGPPAPAAHVL